MINVKLESALDQKPSDFVTYHPLWQLRQVTVKITGKSPCPLGGLELLHFLLRPERRRTLEVWVDIGLEGRALLDDVEHHAEVEQRGDVEVGRREVVGRNVSLVCDRLLQRIHRALVGAVTEADLKLRRRGIPARGLVAHRGLAAAGDEEQPA